MSFAKYISYLSVRTKLVLIIILITTTSILITILVTSYSGVKAIKTSLLEEMVSSAEIVGSNSNAAVIFDDKKTALLNLRSLATKPSFSLACLYNSKKNIFVEFGLENQKLKKCPPTPIMKQEITDDKMSVMHTMLDSGDIIGYLYIEASLDNINNYIQKQTLTALAVIIFCISTISFPLALRMQSIISDPINKLVGTTKDALERNKLGLTKTNNRDELALLTLAIQLILRRAEELRQQNIRDKNELLALANNTKTALDFLVYESEDATATTKICRTVIDNKIFGKINKEYKVSFDVLNSSNEDIIASIERVASAIETQTKTIGSFESVELDSLIASIFDSLNKKYETSKILISKLQLPLIIDCKKEALYQTIESVVLFLTTSIAPENIRVDYKVSKNNEVLIVFNFDLGAALHHFMNSFESAENRRHLLSATIYAKMNNGNLSIDIGEHKSSVSLTLPRNLVSNNYLN